jgi:hypothetical protein
MSEVELPDIVYVVRHGQVNQELKFSLRSLANLPHRRVFVVGSPPDWLTNVTVVDVPKRQNKFDTVQNNVRAVLNHPGLGEHFIYFNDDFFVTKPIDGVLALHGGPASLYRPRQEIWMRYNNTLKHLANAHVLLPATYDGTHVPLPIVTDLARRWVPETPSGCLWRTWYGNRAGIGGTQTRDVKHRKGPLNTEGPFLSSGPTTFREVRKYLEDVLPRKTPYAHL